MTKGKRKGFKYWALLVLLRLYQGLIAYPIIYALLVIDRLIMVPAIWRDMPDVYTIDKFEHEKKHLKSRLTTYLWLVLAALLLYFIITINVNAWRQLHQILQ